jgi:hypothetical protein
MKKRPFLLPLTLSIAALMGTAVAGNELGRSLFPPKTMQSSSIAPPSANFVLTRNGNSSPFAQHESHESHSSHGSHGSHNSHSSHVSSSSG